MQAVLQILRVASSANVALLRILAMCQPSETHSSLTDLNRRAESGQSCRELSVRLGAVSQHEFSRVICLRNGSVPWSLLVGNQLYLALRLCPLAFG